jgi:alanine dehydrogenase
LDDQHLLAGLNVYRGKVTNEGVAQALNLPFVAPAAAIAG